MAHLSNVAARVHAILDATDKRIAFQYGDDLPDLGAELLTVAFTAEDKDDVAAVEILASRGVARWVAPDPDLDAGPGVGESFVVEALGARKQDLNAGQTKAMMMLGARIDALEGMVDKLLDQNERLLGALGTATAKELPAAKKKKAAKKAGSRG